MAEQKLFFEDIKEGDTGPEFTHELGRTDLVGVGNLREYKVRFTKQTWPGETLTTRVTVQKKYEEHGENRVDLHCEVVNEGGEAKISGVAVAALPTRG